MRISIYIACLLLGIAATPYVAFANGLNLEVAGWIAGTTGMQGDLVLLVSRLLVTVALLFSVHLVAGLLAGELNLLMAICLAIVPVYNAAARFIGNFTGSRLSINEIFYAHGTRDVTIFGGFGDLLVVTAALLLSYWLVRWLLGVLGIRSFSV